MRCPLEKSDMIVVEHQNIELDYCLKCRGVWFDSGELDLFISVLKSQGVALSNTELLTPNSAKISEAKRKCPICGRKMEKVWIGKEPGVLIDSCPQGDGLWFDGGELNQILCLMESTHKEGTKDVLSFLSDTFKAGCKTDNK
jgi:uncharacterized protein